MHDIVHDVIEKVNAEYSSDGIDSNALMCTIIKIAEKKQKTCGGIELFADNVNEIEEDEGRRERSDLIDLNENAIIIEELEKIKEKKIRYTESEKKTVIGIFETVKSHYETKGSSQSYYFIAKRVKELLLNYSGYCSLVPQNIRNWYLKKDLNRKKRGVKVVQSFEAEVLGNLMICIMERNNEVTENLLKYSYFSTYGSFSLIYLSFVSHINFFSRMTNLLIPLLEFT